MNRTQNSPKRRQEKQLSARRKHWNHMQVTDRPSPDAPSLTQAIIVQMVYSQVCLMKILTFLPAQFSLRKAFFQNREKSCWCWDRGYNDMTTRPWQKKRALKFALKGSESFKACFELYRCLNPEKSFKLNCKNDFWASSMISVARCVEF